jgi:hypothetical protein
MFKINYMKKSRFSIDTRITLSLNDDREGCFWQEERGPRYGNSRKARSKAKMQLRKKFRRVSKQFTNDELNEKE